MRYAHPSPGPPLARHLALVDHAALEAPAKLDRLIAGAGIDVSELSRRFKDTNPAHEAHEIVAHFYEWLRIHAPDHPVLPLQIMYMDDALAAAGIGPNSRFSTETAAFDRHGNDHCPADEERWFAWIESARALHKCTWWDDDAALVSDICEAVDAYAPILIFERLG